MGFTTGTAAAPEEDAVAELLEFAASDDAVGFRLAADREPSAVHATGLWYGRCSHSASMALLHRTPLMVAASYGSLDVLRLILSLCAAAGDVDRRCGPDGVTALHCAASGGALTAVAASALLLSAGADPNATNAAGLRPVDVISIAPKLSSVRSSLEVLLGRSPSSSDSPPLSPSSDSTSLSSSSSSPTEDKKEKKTYPIDPSIPDINSSLYASDEFRMFAFKIQPCSRAYSHDWTECPFVHPGENARRRDPRRFQYSCTPCPEFRRHGQCPKGDLCEYAHGVFECWLHPAQFRTRLCKDGDACSRRVCFFAHSIKELRSLPNSPALLLSHLPRNNTQLSRLRIPHSNESDVNLSPTVGIHNGRLEVMNLEEMLVASASLNCSSPRFQSDYLAASLSPTSRNQRHQHQSLPSPGALNSLQCVSSPLRLSPRCTSGVAVGSPLGSNHPSLAIQREKLEQQLQLQQMRNIFTSSAKWDSLTMKSELVMKHDMARSNGTEEPDLSWVQSLVGKPHAAPGGTEVGGKAISTIDEEQAILRSWLEQMQLDHKVAL